MTGKWMIAIDEWAGIQMGAIALRIAERTADGVLVHRPDGSGYYVPRNGAEAAHAADVERDTWLLPEGCKDALIAALAGKDPASERLTSTVERILEREAGRVDKFLDKLMEPPRGI